ncbi:MAG TPA: ECF-type sigma factor [Luteimonas sp.]|nr:ECF-type sigma factor [Luteimonas sp.]
MTAADITALVVAAREGDAIAEDALYECVYGELKLLARRQLRRGASPTLDTTGLVHDAYLKLHCPSGMHVQDRRHFFALAAKAMRQVIVDHARANAALKRGGDAQRFALEDAGEIPAHEIGPDGMLQLDRALTALESEHPRLAALVEMRFFAGMELAEIAELQSVSERTLNRDWRRARAELYAALYP